MLGKFFECEADKKQKYYRVISTMKEYKDGRRFPIDEVVIADNKVDLYAEDITKIGGFYISTYDYIFRWLIRGDTLCEVIIPEDSKIYKTTSKNGIYVSEKIILTNPIKIDDDMAMELYKNSKLPENSYFNAMAACAICGYMKTAMKVFDDKVNSQNVSTAISEIKVYCERRKKEKYIVTTEEIDSANIILDKLYKLKNNNNL